MAISNYVAVYFKLLRWKSFLKIYPALLTKKPDRFRDIPSFHPRQQLFVCLRQKVSQLSITTVYKTFFYYFFQLFFHFGKKCNSCHLRKVTRYFQSIEIS